VKTRKILAGIAVASALAAMPLAAEAPVVLDKEIDVSGYRLHYLEAGTGTPVVLLHGLGADVRTWRQAIPRLATHAHVFALDQLGFGRSEKPQIAYRVQTLVDSLQSFLDAVHVSKATVVGNSLGGWVAAAFATAHPERLVRLVLVDAAGYGEPGQIIQDYLGQFDPAMVARAEQFLGSMTVEDRRTLEAAVASYFARTSSRPDGYAMASLIESIVRGEDALGSSVQKIRAPTLVVWGRNDRVVPLRVGDALASDIPDARKVVLDGCGHRPQAECPAAFNEAVEQFLKEP
jgi:pimeloyl-ACP methyl ester carboxylesterase